MAKVIYLTKEGLEKLEDELKYLKEVKRLDIAEKLKEAISFGDLSENAEYEEARNEQAQVEVRIIDIEKQLKNVEIIKESSKSEAGKINMGTTVTIEDTESKEKLTYKIVGSTESDILAPEPRISNDSPVGSALMGKKKGDTIKVKSPAGTASYKIISLK